MPASIDAYISQRAPVARSQKRPFLMWLAAVLSAFVVFGLALLAPLCLAHGHPSFAQLIYKAFSPLCHQMAERSFHLGNYPHAVCARCFGLYGGFVLSIVVYPLVRPLDQTSVPGRAWLIAAALPTTIDWALGYAGLWENTHLSRSITGALLGAVSVLYIMPGLVDLSRLDWRNSCALQALRRRMARKAVSGTTIPERSLAEQ